MDLPVIFKTLERYSISQEVVQKFHDVSFANKSGYYWYNATFSLNIDNKDFIAGAMAENRGEWDILRYLGYISNNIEVYLNMIVTNFTRIYNKLYILPLNQATQVYFESVKSRPSRQNDNMYNTCTSPFLQDVFFSKLLHIFNLPLQDLYVANRATPFYKQRSVYANAFIKQGIKPNFDKPIFSLVSNLEDLVGFFVNGLAESIHFKVLRKITSLCTYKDTFENKVIYQLSNKYLALEYTPVLTQIEALQKIEECIFEDIYNLEPEFRPEADPPSTLPPSDYSLIPQNTPVCEFQISPETIFKILNTYPRIINTNMNISYFMPTCPIQARYIIRTFKYYRNQELSIENNKILNTPREQSVEEITPHTQYKFNMLKKMVRFDGDYDQFRGIISLVPFHADEVHNLESIFYNLNGFRCSAIVAELLNFHFNMYINSRNMYTLLSKLSPNQLDVIDKENSCKLNTGKLDIFEHLGNEPEIVQCYNHIKRVCIKLLAQNTFHGKVAVATKIHCNIITLLQYYRKSCTPANQKEVLPILMLTSNAPTKFKEIVYRKLPKYCINTAFKWMSKEEDVFEIKFKKPSEPYDLYNQNSLPEDNFNVIDDYLQYIKVYKDYPLYKRLRIITKRF